MEVGGSACFSGTYAMCAVSHTRVNRSREPLRRRAFRNVNNRLRAAHTIATFDVPFDHTLATVVCGVTNLSAGTARKSAHTRMKLETPFDF
jgi:hypothetical protein